jgi:hypothetical protein
MPGPYYLWAVDGKPVRVEIALSVVERLSALIAESFRISPDNPRETTGILLGRAAKSGSLQTIWIDDFEPIQGAPSQLRKIRDQLPVGLYRGRGGDGLRLDASDAARIEKLFNRPDLVYLLVQPAAGAPAQAAFFVQENARIQGFAPLREFPFHAELLRTGGYPLTEGLGRRSAARSRSAPLGLAIAGLVFGGGALWYGFGRQSVAPAPAPVAVSAPQAQVVEKPPDVKPPVPTRPAKKRRTAKVRRRSPTGSVESARLKPVEKAGRPGRVRRALSHVPGLRRFGKREELRAAEAR